mgnify:CR=1 FL=1
MSAKNLQLDNLTVILDQNEVQEMGTVEEGRLADLVLLSRNPLDDITNTRSVLAVVSRGEFLSREELDALVR